MNSFMGGSEGEPIPIHFGPIFACRGLASYAAAVMFGMCQSSSGSFPSIGAWIFPPPLPPPFPPPPPPPPLWGLV